MDTLLQDSKQIMAPLLAFLALGAAFLYLGTTLTTGRKEAGNKWKLRVMGMIAWIFVLVAAVYTIWLMTSEP